MFNRLFRFFNPPFLRRLDHYLLINYPALWLSKIHYLLFYGLLSAVLVAGFVPFLTPVQLADLKTVKYATVALLLPFAGWWLYTQTLVYDSYRLMNLKGSEAGRLLLYLLSVGIFAGLFFGNIYLFHHRIATIVSPQELIADIKAMNLGNVYFPSRENDDQLYERDKSRICQEYTGEETGSFTCRDNGCQNTHFKFRRFHSYSYPRESFGRQEIRQAFLNASPVAAEKAVRDFLHTADKYGIEFSPSSPADVLQLYRSGSLPTKILMERAEQKSKLNRAFHLIYRVQEQPFTINNQVILLSLLPLLLMAYQYAGWKPLLISAAATMVLLMGGIFVVGIGLNPFIQVIVLCAGVILLAMLKFSRFSTLKAAGIVMIMPISMILILCIAKHYEWDVLWWLRPQQYKWVSAHPYYPAYWTTVEVVSILVALLVFISVCSRMLIRLKNLPCT